MPLPGSQLVPAAGRPEASGLAPNRGGIRRHEPIRCWSHHNPGLALCGSLVLLLLLGCDGNPFSQVPISGTVTYEDGTPIPAKMLKLWFTCLEPPKDARTHPRPASAPVDLATGTIGQATTYRYEDGVIRGRHRVHLDLEPANLVPRDYTSAATTPLEVDTGQLPFAIKIPKPK